MLDRYGSEPKAPPEELKIPEEFHDEYLSFGIEYNLNTGSSGEGEYGYFFYVPEEASDEILDAMDWERGGCVELSLNAFDSPDDHDMN